jgi:putative membrane protein
MLELTPFTLLIFGGLVLIWSAPEGGSRLLLWGGSTYLVTVVLEALGVATGFIFGPYHYGGVLGPSLFAVPLVIGFNWVLVVFGAVRLSAMLTNAPLMASVISALTAVVFDYVLEPVAVRLGYWTWQPGGYTTTVVPALTGAAGTAVPVRNFVAWFVIAFAASLVYHGMHVRVRSRLPVYYLGVQFVFFLILLGGLVL